MLVHNLQVGIVVNPHARRTGAPGLPARLQAQCESHGVKATLAVTGSEAELSTALGGFARQGIDVLAVCGGDGTLVATVGAAISTYGARLPTLVILPGGTMNTVAANLGVRGRPEAVLGRVLATLSAAGPKGLAAVPRFVQDFMRVVTLDEQPLPRSEKEAAGPAGNEKGSRTRHGCIFSAAMGARYLLAYSRHPGLGWAAWLGLRTVGSSLIPGGGPFARWLFERTPAELTIDGEPADEPAFRLLLCATVPDVGLGMRVPWRAGTVRGRFQIIASSLPITKNALQLGRMLRGQPLQGAPHLDRMAKEVRMRFATPQPLTLDGELFWARTIELSLSPALEILIPSSTRSEKAWPAKR